jgi:hypothetical protein
MPDARVTTVETLSTRRHACVREIRDPQQLSYEEIRRFPILFRAQLIDPGNSAICGAAEINLLHFIQTQPAELHVRLYLARTRPESDCRLGR